MQRKSFVYKTMKFLVVLALLFFVTFQWILLPAKIIGDSMYPTMENNQVGLSFIFAKEFSLDRFDVVIIEEQGELIIKRIIGLPNEVVEYRDGQLYIDGQFVDEPFLDNEYRKSVELNSKIPFTYRFAKVQLKQDEYFVMGDNRPRSQDSRYFGPVKKEEILSEGFFYLFMEK